MEVMGTSQDTFLRFVDSLTSHLDDHQARGDELAARAHLSRFHFDRVIGAVAGESAARFRRRVLLERGAYRLITAEVFTYGMIAHVLTFAAHRRTLVALALKKAGAGDLGWGDPMRWMAEPR
jgi:AraC-like DNA-binding protein